MLMHQGARVLVTGAGRGIGRSCAIAFMRAGADVAVTDLAFPVPTTVSAAERAGPGRCLQFSCDVTDYDAVQKMVDDVVLQLGGLDILVSSAVYSDRGPFEERDPALIAKTLNVSLLGGMHVLRAATVALKRSMDQTGRKATILLISSPHAEIDFGHCEAYNAAKAGLERAAFSLMTANIRRLRTIALHPGFTRTPGEEAFTALERFDRIAEGLPQGRMIEPEEVGTAAVKLADPDLPFLWGVVRFDGGLGLPHWANRTSETF